MATNPEMAVVLKLVADQFQRELKKSEGMLGSFNSFVTNWKTQLTAVGGVLFAIAKSTANYGDELAKASQRIGISVEALAGLQHAAKLADVSNQDLATGLGILSRRVVDAAGGSREALQAFQQLNVQFTDQGGNVKTTEQLLLALSDRFAKMPDGIQKTALAMDLFGRGGRQMIPLLNEGAAGIQAMQAEAKKLGLVLTTEQAKASEQFNDDLTRLQGAMKGLTLQLGTALLPAFTDLIELMTRITSGPVGGAFGQWLKGVAHVFDTINTAIVQLIGAMNLLFSKESAENFTQAYKEFLEQQRLIAQDFEARARQRFGVGAAPSPEARLQGPGPVAPIATDEGDVPNRFRLNLDLLRAQTAASASLAGAKERLLAFDLAMAEQAKQAMVEQRNLRVEEQRGLLQDAEERGATLRERSEIELTLLKAQRQQDLADTELTASQKLAIETRYRQQVHAMQLRLMEAERLESRDFLSGLKEGITEFITGQNKVFNLGVQVAAQTAQQMQQAFSTIFFDAMEGRIRSWKDVLLGLASFVKQITANIAAWLATIGIIKLVGGAALFSSTSTGPGTLDAGTPIGGPTATAQHGGQFRIGGFGSRDDRLVSLMARSGERLTVETPQQQQRGDQAGGVIVNIHNTPPGTQADVDTVRQGEQFVINVVLRNIRQNGPLRTVFGGT